MKPISYLNGVRRTLPDTLSIGAGAITANDLYGGVSPQPFGERVGFAVREEIERPGAFQMDEHGAVSVSATPGPIVDTKHLHVLNCFRVALPQNAQDCVRAHGDAELKSEP